MSSPRGRYMRRDDASHGLADDCRRGYLRPDEVLEKMAAEPERRLQWKELYAICRGMLRGPIVDRIEEKLGSIASSKSPFEWTHEQYTIDAFAVCTVTPEITAAVYHDAPFFTVRIYENRSLAMHFEMFHPGHGSMDLLRFQAGTVCFDKSRQFTSIAMKSWRHNDGDSFDCTAGDVREIDNSGAIRVYWGDGNVPMWDVFEEIEDAETRYVIKGPRLQQVVQHILRRYNAPFVGEEPVVGRGPLVWREPLVGRDVRWYD
ncbi:hypothetical protein T484DRAFT_1758278 [Baffinella frigidus]|nr:hypothetical protein T484DRAFT_1758278 [Cryptophyta sp. CCMP2293]